MSSSFPWWHRSAYVRMKSIAASISLESALPVRATTLRCPSSTAIMRSMTRSSNIKGPDGERPGMIPPLSAIISARVFPGGGRYTPAWRSVRRASPLPPCVPARTRLDFDNHRTIEEPWPPPHGRYSPRRSWTQRSRCWRRRHVSVLRNAGLITSRRDGTWAYYTARRRPRCGSRSGATIVTSPARCPTGGRWDVISMRFEVFRAKERRAA